jgi:sugar phosphate isomerase/epimerase
MKTAVSTLACNGWSLEKSLDISRKNRIDALEIRMGMHPWSQLDLTDEEYSEIGKKIGEAGLCVSDLGTSVVIKDDNEDALKELERCAQIAQILGCKGLRIMLGEFHVHKDEPSAVDYPGIVQWMKKADLLMSRYETEIWIETHNEFATGRSLNSLMHDCDIKNCRLIWDIMHPLESGETIEETYSLMKPRLGHVHIKDGKPWPDRSLASFRYTRIGEGTIDIAGIVRMLQKDGYRGYYSLEWEGVWRKELNGEGYEPEKAIASFRKLMDSLQKES